MSENAGKPDVQMHATKLESEMTEEEFLAAYKKKTYPKPAATADIAVFRRAGEALEILLIRRGNHPCKGCWALPGGFVDPGEDVVDAAVRELEEETGLTGVVVELFGIYGKPGRDPRGWTVSGGYCALVDVPMDAQAGDDAADARWCAVSERRQDGDGASPRFELTISCGEGDAPYVVFERVEQHFGAPRAHVVESGGFAFDHGQLIADAYLKVQDSS